MDRLVITTGGSAVDIDAYACVIAYSELLKLLRKNCLSVIGPLNHSVTERILALPTKFVQSHLQKPEDKFILVDFSEPDYIPKFITDQSKIVAVYDHHFGYENYWKEKIGEESHIEKVGACATLIWEEFEKVDLVDKISTISANLLYSAIVSNTLNFRASVTDKRDKDAFEKLKKYISLPVDWIETYFRDQEKVIYENPEEIVKGDTKIVSYPNLPFSLVIGQLELWNSKELFIQKYLEAIEKGLSTFGNPHFFLTSPSISEGKNYIFTNNQDVKNLLEKTLGIKFSGDVAQTDKLILRKEILKKLQVIK